MSPHFFKETYLQKRIKNVDEIVKISKRLIIKLSIKMWKNTTSISSYADHSKLKHPNLLAKDADSPYLIDNNLQGDSNELEFGWSVILDYQGAYQVLQS